MGSSIVLQKLDFDDWAKWPFFNIKLYEGMRYVYPSNARAKRRIQCVLPLKQVSTSCRIPKDNSRSSQRSGEKYAITRGATSIDLYQLIQVHLWDMFYSIFRLAQLQGFHLGKSIILTKAILTCMRPTWYINTCDTLFMKTLVWLNVGVCFADDYFDICKRGFRFDPFTKVLHRSRGKPS